ncbi:ABC transporter ATP-binding protein [Microbulbifer sp. ZKSA004]|uniref:ABC transporter ATP-binding protein n=1 Tax=Microbulbifer sp. ZKSA004 TaxID=3243389 RepID=UPI00403931E5
MNIIEINNLSKVFTVKEIETHALININLEIKKGEYVSISGPSGSGKSTLLSILGLLDRPTSGTYKLENYDVHELNLASLSRMRNEKIGFVFQQFNLIDQYNVFDNVALPLLYGKERLSNVEIKERVLQCINTVGLSSRVYHKPNQLSGGQQQRVAIARALVRNPSVLLVDEPTGNLDSKIGDQIIAMLGSLHEQGTTIAMVTHDSRYADCAERKIELLDGRIDYKREGINIERERYLEKEA